MNSDILNNIVSQLYNAPGNALMCSKLTSVNNFDLQNILRTPAQHKGLLEGSMHTDYGEGGYLRVTLKPSGIPYYENGFKFDREVTPITSAQINIGNLNNNGNLALQNHGIKKNEFSDNSSRSWQDNIGSYFIVTFICLLVEYYFFK